MSLVTQQAGRFRAGGSVQMDPLLNKSSSAKNVMLNHQMGNLHPAFPTSTRIAVVGGGPGGLAAALCLIRLGYEDVTVLEREATVGGMCASAVIEGRAYDLGGQVLARDSSPTIRSLMSEMDVEMEDMSRHRLAEIDCTNGNFEDLKVAADYMSVLSVTLKLQNEAAATGRLGVHALSDIANKPADEFLRSRGFRDGVPTAVANGFTASGYRYPADIPYAYLHEFARTSMLGKIWRVKGGYGSFWEKVALSLPDVRCGVQVKSVDRRGGEVHLSIEKLGDGNSANSTTSSTVSVLTFDKLIMTGSSYLFLDTSCRTSSTECERDENCKFGGLDYTEEEKRLFSKVHIVQYYTTVLRISGLDLPVGFYYPKVYKDDPTTVGHPVAIQRFYADTDFYLLWSYGNDEVDQQKMTEFLYEDVKSMGGHVQELVLQRKWRYFPHVSSKDMADGFYDEMELLQGKNDTFYIGALLAFELTERNVCYAFDLMKKHFGTSEEHPYVKRLIPPAALQLKNNHEVEEMQELPGVEFPEDLPSLDSYLSYYAKHQVLGNQILYTWLDDQGREADKRTFAELDFKASLVAQALKLNGKQAVAPGERVILLHPPGLDFIEAFFGCIRARVIPVPMIPPDPTQRAGQALAKVENVAKACKAKAILSTYAYHAAVRAASLKNILTSVSTSKKTSPAWPDLPWHHTDWWTKRGTSPWNLNWFFRSASFGHSSSASRIGQVSDVEVSSPGSKPPRSRSMPGSPRVGPELVNTRSFGHESKVACEESGRKMAQDLLAGPPPDPTDLCFLQFTSGSTGDSKGVMITHGGLLHNVKLMRRQYGSTSRTVLVSWLPQYHDMGLIGGLFTAMLSGGTAVLFSPTTFIRKPLLWLETMDKYRCTHSAGPNFAFELIVKRLETLKANGTAPNYDLCALRFLMVSAEPVRQKTVKSFLELLHDSGLQEQTLAPAYGLAENCVFVCVAFGRRLPILIDWQGRVCCGYAEKGNKDVDLRIVDPTSFEEAGEGCEGEIWVWSPSIGVGYWGQKELGEQTFSNTIANASSEDKEKKFLRTGDLGRIVDGKLFVTGRIKDLIIVRGRNFYPADIEKTVENCSDSLRPGCCAVFSASQNVLQEKGLSCEEDAGVVVVAEVRDETKISSGLQAQIMATVAEEYGVQVACVNFIKPRTIPKTTSGKLRRIECLKRFADGKLESVKAPRVLRRWVSAPNRSASLGFSPLNSPGSVLPSPGPEYNLTKPAISDFLVQILAERTGLPVHRISVQESFANYNIDSVGVVWAAQKLSDFLGAHVAPIDIYTAGCITELVEAVQKKTRRLSMSSSSFCSTPTTPRTPASSAFSSAHPNNNTITKFVFGLVAEKTGIPVEDINETQNLAAYNIDSVGVVWAAQKLSDYLGVHVPAIDIYTAGCIKELVQSAQASMLNSQSKQGSHAEQRREPSLDNGVAVQDSTVTDHEGETLTDQELEYSVDPSPLRRFAISSLQALGLLYIATLLLIPAALIFSPIARLATYPTNSTLGGLLLALISVPLAWILYMLSIPIIISLLGSSLLQPNFTLASAIPLWSMRYVRWWTLHRLQMFASSTVAIHFRGTIFLKCWYQLLGAQIGERVQLDSTDLTDPCLLYVGDGAVVGEGATVQCHEVKGGIVFFRRVKINNGAQVGPFAVIQSGTTLGARASIGTLSKTEVGEHVLASRTNFSTPMSFKEHHQNSFLQDALQQFIGLYIVGMVSTASAVVAYASFQWLVTNLGIVNDLGSTPNSDTSTIGFVAFALSATFPWAVTGIAPLVAYENPTVLLNLLLEILKGQKVIALLISLGASYFVYGLTLAAFSVSLKWCLVGEMRGDTKSRTKFTTWLVHALLRFTHSKFVSLLSGTEASSIYLRSLGAKIGKHASIRRVNALVDPDLISLGEGSHLGDFANIITTSSGTTSSSSICIGAKCIVGAQCVIMPGAVLEDRSMLGAMSVAASNVRLESGGVYMGVGSPIKIFDKNATVSSKLSEAKDYRINQMDSLYQKIVANLSASIGRTTISVNARYFHRMGVGGKGMLRFFDRIPGLPEHDTFAPGRCFPVVLRHSNSLSGDDDARLDARGASIRILEANSLDPDNVDAALLDLTLKTGRGFYARNMVEFVGWLTKNHAARLEHVKKFPHTADMIWDSLRSCDSYTQMHYYSNIARLFRSISSDEYYVKFKLRPEDTRFGEDCGLVKPTDLIPPETGAIPRSSDDDRPLQFLNDDFKKLVSSPHGVKYILQMQFCLKSESPDENEDALDCTRAWDERSNPYLDVAEVHLTEVLDDEMTESIRFNPRNGPSSLSMIPATSAFESASMDHGRSLAYDIAQYSRNGMPLPIAWQGLLKKADMPLADGPHSQQRQRAGGGGGGGCPVLSGAAVVGTLPENVRVEPTKQNSKLVVPPKRKPVESINPWVLKMIRFCQPFLQTIVPVTALCLAFFPSVLALAFVGSKAGNKWMLGLLPLAYLISGLLFTALSAGARWVLVGLTKEDETCELWGFRTLLDTTWQSINVVLCSTFMELGRGSLLLIVYLRGLGATIDSTVYLDTVFALNPDLLSIGAGTAVGHNALLFGHLYEGGKVGFKPIHIGEHTSVGTRALLLPGLRMQDRSQIGALGLGMKDEVVVGY